MRITKEIIRLPATVTIPIKTQKARSDLLALAETVPPVTSAETQQYAVEVGQNIRKLEKMAEELRKAETGPLDKRMKEINRLVAEYVEPLKAKRQQFEEQISAFRQKEIERVAREEAARASEVKRLEDEANASKNMNANGDIAEQEIAAYQNEMALQAVIAAPLAEPIKARGSSTRQELDWKCTDINALYAARPDLCFPPTPKASAIKSSCVPEMPVPGLEMKWRLDTSIRSV